jgi:hypothetical protein
MKKVMGEISLLGLEPMYLVSSLSFRGVVSPRRISVIFLVVNDIIHYVAFGIYSLIAKVLFNFSELHRACLFFCASITV